MQEIRSSFKYLSLCLLVLTIAFSCKKDYKTNVPSGDNSIAEFAPASGLYTGSYFIKSTNDPYLLPVGFNGFSDADRTINFTVTSRTAIAGTQYTAPSPVVIKAGQVLDTLRFRGLFSGYPTGRKDTVTIKLTGYRTVNSIDSFRLVIQPYCDVNINSFVGAYTKSYDIQTGQPTYGPYLTTFSSPVYTTGATTGTIKISNFWDVGGPAITVNLDWTDPGNFKTSIPAQFLYTDPTYGAATITGVGNGTFASCNNTFTFSYKVTVAAGSFGNFTTTIAR